MGQDRSGDPSPLRAGPSTRPPARPRTLDTRGALTASGPSSVDVSRHNRGGELGRASQTNQVAPEGRSFSLWHHPDYQLVRDVSHLTSHGRTLLQSARLRFGRERLRATVHRPVAAYASRRGIQRVLSQRANGIAVGIERIPSVAVINLRERSDRLSSFMDEMGSLGIEGAQRFEAVYDQHGPLGCARSHAALLRHVLEANCSSVMICEDDTRFRTSREKLDALVDKFLDDENAEVACLAFSAQKTARYNTLFLRAVQSQNTGCYIVKRTIARDLLNAFEDGIAAMASGGHPLRHSIDIVWKELQRSRVFVPTSRTCHLRSSRLFGRRAALCEPRAITRTERPAAKRVCSDLARSAEREQFIVHCAATRIRHRVASKAPRLPAYAVNEKQYVSILPEATLIN